MFKILRIICSILSAICVAAAFPIFVFLKEIPGIICVAVALLFFVLTMLFKSLQETSEPAPENEQNDTPPSLVTDENNFADTDKNKYNQTPTDSNDENN